MKMSDELKREIKCIYLQGACPKDGEEKTGVLRHMGGDEQEYKTIAPGKERRRREIIQIIGKASKRQKTEEN